MTTGVPSLMLASSADPTQHLLHAMHDASKFAEGMTKAILEGVLHSHEYGERRGKFKGKHCTCPHCKVEGLPRT